MVATKKQLERGRNIDGSPNEIDVYVGKQLKLRRKMAKMSLEEMTNLLGVSFQQIQKYEKGSNRISCGRLYKIASALGVDVCNFFPPIDAVQKDVMKDPQILELVYLFKKIENENVANNVIGLLKAVYS